MLQSKSKLILWQTVFVLFSSFSPFNFHNLTQFIFIFCTSLFFHTLSQCFLNATLICAAPIVANFRPSTGTGKQLLPICEQIWCERMPEGRKQQQTQQLQQQEEIGQAHVSVILAKVYCFLKVIMRQKFCKFWSTMQGKLINVKSDRGVFFSNNKSLKK